MAAAGAKMTRQIWGRRNSVNVRKVLWCSDELGVEYELIEAGMNFGRNSEPGYLAMNPNGRVPLLVEGDFVLWESNSIMRYLAMEHGRGSSLYPEAPKARAGVDRWLGSGVWCGFRSNSATCRPCKKPPTPQAPPMPL
jgi:glutathione S-transferase